MFVIRKAEKDLQGTSFFFVNVLKIKNIYLPKKTNSVILSTLKTYKMKNKIVIVVSKFNKLITDELLAGVLEELNSQSVNEKNVQTIEHS